MVLVEADDASAPKKLRQASEEGGVGPIERIHGLVGVTDDEEVRLVTEQGGEQAELCRIHILHLVDEEVPGAPPDAVGEAGIAGQGVGTGDDEIVEVQQSSP